MEDKEFEKKIFDTISAAGMCISLALGQELQLFDHVTAEPQTAAQIAESAGYKQRYVEQWLKALAFADFIEVSTDGNEFWIPAHRKQYFSKMDPLMSIAGAAPGMAEPYFQVKECFKKDGPAGLPYSCYPHFSHSMSAFSDLYQNEKRLIPGYFSMVPNVIEQLRNGGRFLDIGCGRGNPSYLVAKAFPECQSYGADTFDVSIKYAKARAQKENLKNLHYLEHDAANLPSEWSNTFDYVTLFQAIHDQFYPEKVFNEIYKVLKPGGHLSIVETNVSVNTYENKSRTKLMAMMYNCSILHCVPVGSQVEGAAGLGTVAGMEIFLAMAKKAGFIQIKADPMPDLNYLLLHMIFQKPT